MNERCTHNTFNSIEFTCVLCQLALSACQCARATMIRKNISFQNSFFPSLSLSLVFVIIEFRAAKQKRYTINDSFAKVSSKSISCVSVVSSCPLKINVNFATNLLTSFNFFFCCLLFLKTNSIYSYKSCRCVRSHANFEHAAIGVCGK